MSVQTIRLNMSTTAQAGAVSRIRLVSQSVTGPSGSPMSAAAILTALLTVDGAGSGLDADLLDGNSSAAFATAAQGATADTAVQPARSISTTAPLTGGGDLSANRTLAVSAASDTATGVVELATSAETITGTDATRAVTPAGGKAAYATLVDPLGLGFPLTIFPFSVATFVAVSAANRAYYLRCLGGATITKISTRISVSSGNIDVGAYDATGALAAPGARLGSSGSIACPTAGLADISLTASTAVPSGSYLAIAADNTTATFAQPATGSGNSLNQTGLAYNQSGAFPLPATASGTGTGERIYALRGVV